MFNSFFFQNKKKSIEYTQISSDGKMFTTRNFPIKYELKKTQQKNSVLQHFQLILSVRTRTNKLTDKFALSENCLNIVKISQTHTD